MVKIISLGGSALFKDNLKFNSDFLLDLKNILKISDDKFVIIIGGGKIARLYVNELRRLNLKLNRTDYDNMGLTSIRLNVEFLSSFFKDMVFDTVNTLDHNIISEFQDSDKKILLYFGKTPGYTSDYNAVQAAMAFKEKIIYNLTDVDYVYDKDPRMHDDAKALKKISWDEYFEIMGSDIESCGHYPFDPIASKTCQQYGIKVYTIKFDKHDLIEALFLDKDFDSDKFTIIS